MKLKSSTDYAIRIVCYLATHNGMISTTELSEQLYIASTYIPKVAKKLKDANIIVACEGVKDGYTLAKRAEDISLKEIVSCEEELDKKYQKDLEYRLLVGTLSSEEEDEVANILGLNDTDDLRVVTFRLLPKNKSGRFTSEQLRQTEIVEKELLRDLPKKYTTSNTNQIIYIYKKDEQISNLQFQLRIEELQKKIQNNLDKRNANAEFVVGIGKDVKGYRALKNSFSDSKMALDYIRVIQKIIGDENRFVVDCSKLGFFRVFADIKDRDKLLSYVPESLQKLYEFDQQKNGELIDTLECFLNNKQSLKQTSNKLFVHYRTVSYRLEKIKEISSMDFDNPEEILAVRNGLIIYRVIETM